MLFSENNFTSNIYNRNKPSIKNKTKYLKYKYTPSSAFLTYLPYK